MFIGDDKEEESILEFESCRIEISIIKIGSVSQGETEIELFNLGKTCRRGKSEKGKTFQLFYCSEEKRIYRLMLCRRGKTFYALSLFNPETM